MDDLVKRLRGYGGNRLWPHGPACDCTQAADRIEALERQVKAADALFDKVSGKYVDYTWVEALDAYSAAKEGGA